MFFTNWSAQLFALRMLQGRLAELRESVEMVSVTRPGIHGWRIALAYLYEVTGDRASALQLYRELTAPSAKPIPDDGLWLFSTCLLTDLAVRLEDHDRFDDLEQRLRPHADELVIVAYAAFGLGPAAMRLGMLNTQLGRYEQAERDLRAAIDLARSSASWPWLAASELELAVLYDARGLPGDRERARGLRETVTEAATANGWNGLLGRAVGPPAAPARNAPVSPW
jgi:hypothetical protein